jgi:FixJ family two-component response regulator
MISKSPDQLPAVLFVNDEPKTCKHFTRLFGPRFRILTANDGIEAMKIFKAQSDEIGIIMTDQRMPNETGTEFLEKAARLKPSVMRILSTAYADVDAAVDAVNNGGIYRYITKPWEVSELEMTLIRAMELFILEHEKETLLTKKSSELSQFAARERILGFAALSVFKESQIRHVADAIGSLIQLGNPKMLPVDLAQWEDLYQNHRQFLELANKALPGKITMKGTFDPLKKISASDVCKTIARNDPRIENLPATGVSPPLPGPLAVLTTQLNQLIDGFRSVIPKSAEVLIQETSQGITLGLPLEPVAQVLHPLFSHTAVSESDIEPCLDLAIAVLRWHHNGGQLKFSQVNSALHMTLGITPFTEVTDPWHHLAAGLVANSSFWERQK